MGEVRIYTKENNEEETEIRTPTHVKTSLTVSPYLESFPHVFLLDCSNWVVPKW